MTLDEKFERRFLEGTSQLFFIHYNARVRKNSQENMPGLWGEARLLVLEVLCKCEPFSSTVFKLRDFKSERGNPMGNLC